MGVEREWDERGGLLSGLMLFECLNYIRLGFSEIFRNSNKVIIITISQDCYEN